MDPSASNEQFFPVVNHDDGIYSHPNELSYGPLQIVDQALEIIQAYRVLEYEKVKNLRKPIKPMEGVPDEVLLKQIKDRAGRITCAASQLNTATTREEHCDPQLSFYQHAEPVYPNFESNLQDHGQHCWKIALLNAYRILDLQRDESLPFPYDWVPIQVEANDIRYSTLLASAAYFMGTYYAKALALQKASLAIKGEKMNNPNEGNYGALGKIINPACKELDKELGILPSKGGSQVLMEYLETRKLGSTQNGLWVIYTEQGDEPVDSKKLGNFISRYRKRNS